MTHEKTTLCALLAALGAAACGNSGPADVDASLKAATIVALPGADAARITISGSERHTAKWTWTATYDGAAYSCDADEQMRLPSCVPKSSSGEA